MPGKDPTFSWQLVASNIVRLPNAVGRVVRLQRQYRRSFSQPGGGLVYTRYRVWLPLALWKKLHPKGPPGKGGLPDGGYPYGSSG
jgi:hypothetical protein